MNNKIEFKEKIYLLNFLLTVGVVYQHTKWQSDELIMFTKAYNFLFYIIQTCVPFFFAISGYLFFRNFSLDKVGIKYKSRIKSLLIPYLIWNAIYAIYTICLSKLGFMSSVVVDDNLGKILLKIINAEFSPLWFVKYLMFFALISPLTYCIFSKYVRGGCVLCIMCILNAIFYYCDIMVVPLNVNANTFVMFNYQYIFYALGAYMAMNFKTVVERTNRYKSVVAIIILIFLIGSYWMPFYNANDVILNHTFRVVFIGCMWFAMDFIPRLRMPECIKCTFFIYCIHMLVVQSIQGVAEIVIGKFAENCVYIYIIEWFLLPIFVVSMIICIAGVLKRHFATIWKVITGGRG